MKLLKLSCDQPSFKTLRFNSEGLTLIVGDASSRNSQDGSSNGVGKTLSLGLVHHCLGANADSKLAASVPDWMFRLDFSLGQDIYTVERSGDGKELFLNGQKIALAAFRRWLNDRGPFKLDDTVERLTFRSLFTRFARYHRDDCTNPLQTRKESEYDGLLRSLYLLGAEFSLVFSKRSSKQELDQIKQTVTNLKGDKFLREVFRTGANPQVRIEWLGKEIEKLIKDLSQFQVAEDYRQIEQVAENLTKKLRENEKNKEIIRFQLAGIEKSLTQQPDISRGDLLALYEGLQSIFRDEILEHFEAVERFHNGLSANRQKRLEQDRLGLSKELDQLESEWRDIARERDKQMQLLHGKRALDEYAATANILASYKEERARLDEFLTFSDKLQERSQMVKEKRLSEDKLAFNYVRTNPIKQADDEFKKLAELLYPRHPSGLVLKNNLGDNQLRYNLDVQITGDDSDGINSARILCLDWVFLMHGANHSMDFLWHDNRLFADIDPRPRARWFSYVMDSIKGSGKQYIASLNTENFDAMEDFLSESEQSVLRSSVKLTLRGDTPENRLLGIHFGKPT